MKARLSFQFGVLCLVLAGAVLAPHSLQAAKAVRALVTNWGGDSIAVIDPAEGRLIADIKTGLKPHGVDIAPDGRTIHVSNEADGTLSFIDSAKNEVISNTGSGDVSIVDVATRRTVKTVKVGKAPKRLTVGLVEVAP